MRRANRGDSRLVSPRAGMIKTTGMPIQTNISGTIHELLVSGRVDGAMANELEVHVLNAIRAGATEIYVNLAEANFLCSAGIRVILQYWRQMKQQGKKLQVTRPSPAVDDILTMTGFKNEIVERTAA